MADTRYVPVFDSQPPSAYISRSEHSLQIGMARSEQPRNSNNPEDFVLYEDSDGEEERTMLNTPNNFFDCIRNREYGMREYRYSTNYTTRHILTHNLFKEWSIPFKKMNKVFCSQWLSSNEIVFGTKCNKLMVYNVKSYKLDQIPSLKGSVDEATNQQSGIHSLKINPSRTLLATSAYNSNEIAVYKMSTLNPIVLAEGAHKDLIHDIEWLDEQFFVSGSRDNTIALWKVINQENYDCDGDLIQPVTQFIKPTVIRNCKTAQNVRAITFNESLKELVTLSLNGDVHVWDVEHFRQKFTKRFSSYRETCCMATKNDSSLYAVGCKSFTLLHDSRTLNIIKKIPAMVLSRAVHINNYGESTTCSLMEQTITIHFSGVRSISFQDNVITIGTGFGVIMFYDIRAGKYLESSTHSSTKVVLKTSTGYVDHEFRQVTYTPAVYTHCYDYSGTRLFSAGGPFQTDERGIYASLWQ